MTDSVDIRYQQCLNALYQKLPMFTRIGAAAYKPDLGNITSLCTLLDNPHHKFKTIHVAGTNGKGSVSHLLAAILQAAGYKTGLYTSPHIHDFRERIKLNGHEVSKEYVLQFWEKHEKSFEEIQPSFFEITVAMAFDFFAFEKVDIAIIEVGLGGLLDSTNIITPEVSVITNISLDHTDLLGKTMEEIARQKGGIIKHQIPVVIGETQSETDRIFLATAIAKQSPISFADQQLELVNMQFESGVWRGKAVYLSTGKLVDLQIGLSGNYQLKNIKTVLQVISVLQQKQFSISDIAIQVGIRDVKKLTGFFGRFDIIHSKPFIILDVSHNEAGIMELMKQVKSLAFKNLHIVTGMVKDKDVHKALSLYPKEANYYFTQAAIPRALPHHELYELARDHQLVGQSFSEVNNACNAAFRNANLEDAVLVTGSFFIISEAWNYFDKTLHSDYHQNI